MTAHSNSPNTYPQGIRTLAAATSALLALNAFLILNPYFFWGYHAYLSAGALLLWALTFFIYTRLHAPRDGLLMSVLTFPAVAFTSYLMGASLLGSLWLGLCATIFFISATTELIRAFRIFRRILVISLLPGLALWVVHHTTKDFDLFLIGKIYGQLVPNPIKAELNIGYFEYPFAISVDYMIENGFYRFHGIFDEPGVIGTVSALMIAADRFRLKSWENLLLTTYGIISFSLAFYILFGIGLFLTLLDGKARKLPIALLALALLSVIVAQFDAPRELIAGRLLLNESGLSGDNRSNFNLDSAFQAWLTTSTMREKLFGLSGFINDGAASWKSIPVMSGLFGITTHLILFILLLKRHKNSVPSGELAFITCFLLSVYQRPGVMNILFLLIFCFGICPKTTIKTQANDHLFLTTTGGGVK